MRKGLQVLPFGKMTVTGLNEASATRVLQFLLIGTAAMILTGIAAVVLKHAEITGHWSSQIQQSFVRLFDLDAEGNIPTWYSSCLLLSAGLLLAWNSVLAQQRKDPYRPWWTFVAFVFFYLSMDETAVIHEMAIKPLHEVFHTGGLLYYGWIIPAGFLVLAFGIFSFRFWLQLPNPIRWLFVVSAVVYVGSALGIEAVQGDFAEKYGATSWAYDWVGVVEESGEMIGVVIFIYSVLLHAIVVQASSAKTSFELQATRAAN
jgi:hypothetical protein